MDIIAIKQRFGIIGNNPALNRAIEVAAQVAVTDLSVLITGESGVGKEFFPQIIHTNSPRKHAKYFAINCGAIPEGTIDSELFGHVKGAYTDARAERKGYFEEANGGTLFLDEVGELPLSTQARLLRVLETGEFIRMGSSEVQKTNVRVVAATNLDMRRAIEEGRFRADLFFRLSAIQVNVPPLRERREDISLLFRKFVADFTAKYGMPRISLSPDALELLQSYYWPGNIRQLKNVAEQLCVLENQQDISASTIRNYLPASGMVTALAPVMGRASETSISSDQLQTLYRMISDLKQEIETLKAKQRNDETTIVPQLAQHHVEEQVAEIVDDTEQVPSFVDAQQQLIKASLEQHHGNRKETAAALGISERTLYRKLKEYGL